MPAASLVQSLRRIVTDVVAFGLPSNGDRALFIEQLQRQGVHWLDAKNLVDAAIADGLERRAPRTTLPPPP